MIHHQIEECFQGSSPSRANIALPSLQIGVKPPDEHPRDLDGTALRGGHGHHLMDEPFGMDPAQGVRADPEQAGIVRSDYRAVQQAMVMGRAPERSFAGDAHRIRRDGELIDAQPGEMCGPGGRIGKDCSATPLMAAPVAVNPVALQEGPARGRCLWAPWLDHRICPGISGDHLPRSH